MSLMQTKTKQATRPIIFLDMDDVLCIDIKYSSIEVKAAFKSYETNYPGLWANLVHTDARMNLLELHTEFFPQYVLSSSWSCTFEEWQMKEVFKRTELDFVAKNLHKEWTTPKELGSSRIKEIENWLAKYMHPKRPILILDDADSGWTLKDSRLDKLGVIVFCEPSIGFNEQCLIEARKILGSQL